MVEAEKHIRLKGKKLRELNDEIFLRDNHKCIICGRWVEEGQKFHHEPCGAAKSDELEKGVVLCRDCHFARHSGKNSREIKEKVRAYLNMLYPKS